MKLNFTTPEEGFNVLAALYATTKIFGEEFIDALFLEHDFDPSIPEHIKFGAIQLFRKWDEDELPSQTLHAGVEQYRFTNGEFVPSGMRVGVVSDGVNWDAKEGKILLDRGILSEKATKIYTSLLNATALKLYTTGGYSYLCDEYSLEPIEAINSARTDDENPIVFSMYINAPQYKQIEFDFDYSDFVNAKISDSGKGFVMSLEDGSEGTIVILESTDTKEGDDPRLALKHKSEGTNFILTGESCWIKVDNLNVYIKKNDEGVSIDVFPMDNQDEPIASTWALYSEAESDSFTPESESK